MATTYSARTTGSFTLTMSAAVTNSATTTTTTPTTTTTAPTADGCTTDLGAFSVVSRALGTEPGSWSRDSSCVSRNRPGKFAEYFTFTLDAENIITIELNSRDVDTYLFLLDGHGMNGRARAHNDDIDLSNGNYNSRLYGRLSAGFLVLVGGASGSLLAAACAGDDADPTGEFRAVADADSAQDNGEASQGAASELAANDPAGWFDDAGVEVVAVEPGLVDMTSWQGEFMTLRPDPAGMVVRSESTGRVHAVAVPDGFAGRCMGAHGDLLTICGHRVVHTGYMTFEAGTPYEALLDQAGPYAELLAAQPNRPDVRPYRHEFIERFPALIVTDNLLDWELFDLSLHAGTGGSFGAVIERGGVLAADHYAFAEVPDSVFEASLISLGEAAAGRVSVLPGAVPVDHGSLWGASDTGTSGLVVVADRRGVRAYDDRRQSVLSIDDDTALLGIDASGGFLNVAVETSDGTRQIRRFRDGVQRAVLGVTASDPIRHRVSPDVTVVAAGGKQSLIPNTSIADRPTAPQ